MTGVSRRWRANVEVKIAAALLLALTTLAVWSALTIANTRALLVETAWMSHTHEVREQLEQVLSRLGRLESDQRGFLLTGDMSFLATSHGDGEAIAATLATVRAMVADNPRQIILVDRLEPLVARRIAVRDEVRDIRHRHGLEAAITALRRNRGRHYMQQVRYLIARMKWVERRLLRARSARAEGRAALTLVAIPASGVFAFLVIAGMSIWIRRDLRAGARAVAELAEVSERFNLALAAAQVGTWSWDVRADVITWDDYVHPLFGLFSGAFGGRYADFMALVHPDDREGMAAAVRQVLANGGELDREFAVLWPDGSEHVLALRGEFYRGNDGQPERLTGVCWDVTDQQRAREQLSRLKEAADAANEAKSEFLTSMSHELRTPMNSIIGFSQLVLRSSRSRLDDEDVDALQTVQRNAKHLLTLINQILDLSRVESGRMSLARGRLDLTALARDVLQETRPLVGEKAITLRLEAPGAALEIDGDETRVRQILTNLVANAIKYTAAGSVTVRIREDEDADIGSVVRVAVVDTGPGIDETDRLRLFQRFSRLDTDATHREGGTGLGLSLSQELARMHGGRIDVASDGVSGSEFVLTLPTGWRPARDLAGVGTGAGGDSGAVTILCVDDEPDVLTMLQRTLEDAGYRVVLASSCEEALAQAAASQPDLVCLDLGLPDSDGFAVVDGLRAHPALARVPVVIVAAAHEERRAIEGGARRYVLKPIDPAALLTTVAGVLATPVSLVLVVDDDRDQQRLLRNVFERQGIGVAVASDGLEALRRLQEVQPDVIVLDLHMPVMNGFEFLRATRDSPVWREIPVVILTGRTLDAAALADLGSTCSAILSKGRDDTVALVRAVTAGGRPARQSDAQPQKESHAV
jgi:PAS domain S-box-containing protein